MFDGLTATPAQIARSIRKGAKLQVAEATFAELNARSTQINREIAALNTNRNGSNDLEIDRAIMRLDREDRDLAVRLGTARREAVELRAARGVEVRQALLPTITAAATRGVAAALALAEAIDTIEAANSELVRAHGETALLLAPDLRPLLERLEKLAAR